MTKQEWLTAARGKLSDLPPRDVEERLGFYSEMIDDRMEEGLSEEAAVAALGEPQELAWQIQATASNPEAEPEPEAEAEREPIVTSAKRQRKPWEILLLALGSPLWISLLLAAVAIVFALVVSVLAIVLSLYVSLWAVVLSLWAVFASLIGCSIGGLVGGIGLLLGGFAPAGVALISMSPICAGLAILAFYGCRAATKAAIRLAPEVVLRFQKCKKRK